MQDKFNQFYGQNNLKSIEKEDASNLDQCFDLAFAWCDFIGIPRSAIRHDQARKIWSEATDETRKYFDLIPNNPNDTNKPSVGDIVVFDTRVGVAGHVAIETGKSDGYNLISFDQNWDTAHYHYTDINGNWIPYSRLVVHYKYYGVVGWLHPKQVQVDKLIPSSQILTILNGPGSDGDKLIAIRKLC